jgi:transcriptional regulator with XRE-family HTH domain
MRATFHDANFSIDAKAVCRELGRRIASMRKERGLSQSRLAAEIGVSFQQVQKYEQGSNQVSVPKLLQIAVAFGINPSDLLNDLSKQTLKISSSGQTYSTPMDSVTYRSPANIAAVK